MPVSARPVPRARSAIAAPSTPRKKRRRSTDIRFDATAFRVPRNELRYGPDQTDPYRKSPRCHLHRFHLIGMRSKIGH
jgi:hypothetical protein